MVIIFQYITCFFVNIKSCPAFLNIFILQNNYNNTVACMFYASVICIQLFIVISFFWTINEQTLGKLCWCHKVWRDGSAS